MTSTRRPAGHHPAEEPLVCVVDDDRSVRRSLGRLLKVSGWRVQSFGTAEAFLADLDKLPRGFLVLDMQLPGMSGPELLERMQAMQLSWPVIGMSGSHVESVEHDALRLGAGLFLHKPFDPQVLVNALEQMARSSDEKPRRCSGQ